VSVAPIPPEPAVAQTVTELAPIDAPAEVQDVVAAYQSRGVWRLALDVFVENRLAVIGVVIIVLLVLFCYVGPLIYQTDQVNANLANADLAPGPGHPLGTDSSGYDLLGRLMVGGQTSLEVGLAAAVIATTFGVVYGAISGFFGRILDAVMMRAVDALLAIPPLFLLLFIATAFTPNLLVLILAVAVVSWLVPARLIRAEALSLRKREYVQAVTMMGGSGARIIGRHIVPNSIGTIVVNATFQVADAVLLVAYLSFLGLGIPPPATNWGNILSGGVDYIYAGYWWLIYPAGVAIVLAVVAFNFLGDAMRDALEVRLQRR
jgi:peptide/nickel transport system permease protein